MIEQLKVPVAEVVTPQLETVAPALMDEVTTTEGVNPVPDRVVVAPTGPSSRERVTEGTVTSNEPSAVWPPESVAVTVVPVASLGTANVQENVPEVLVASDPTVQAVIETSSRTSDVKVEETEKPVPET